MAGEEMLNTREVAQYLGIHEKQVYALIKAKRIPATRITGKWIFPKKLIDEWIETHAKAGDGRSPREEQGIEGALLAAAATTRSSTCFRPIMKKDLSRIPHLFCQYGKHRRAQGPESAATRTCLVPPPRPQERPIQYSLPADLSAGCEARGGQPFPPGTRVCHGSQESSRNKGI